MPSRDGRTGNCRAMYSVCHRSVFPSRVAASSSRLWPVATTSNPWSSATRLNTYRFDNPHTAQVDRDPFFPAVGMSKRYVFNRVALVDVDEIRAAFPCERPGGLPRPLRVL